MSRPKVLPSVEQLPNELYRASGSYVISDRRSGRVLYVGESHTNQLKKTILRHFERWTSGTYKGEHKRHTYDRHKTTVLVYVTPPDRAIAKQNALICDLNPRDNWIVCDLPEGDPF